jgi:flagellar M-ring protein FliF
MCETLFGLVAVGGFLEAFSRFGMQRLAAMVAVTIALVAFFGFIVLRVTSPAMSPLYTDLSMQDSNNIIKELESRGIEYQMRNEGQIIMVPQAESLRLRMDFASRGIPAGGGIGYEVFDKSDNFSSTSFEQQMNKLRALEGELSRTIRTLDRVRNARVHLVVPKDRLFERDKIEPGASIVLDVNGELDASGVRAIRHLVASAVEGLKPERISIVDKGGRLLADGAADGNDAAAMQGEKQSAVEMRMKRQIEEIVASVVGTGRARVQVAADMDFNKIQQTSESFDPESRVIRSTQSRNENSASQEAQNEVTVANQLPQQQTDNAANGPRENAAKADEVINYEISKTTRTEVLEGARLKRLSVAVLVDGTYSKAADGTSTYVPRAQEEIDRITSLVRTAIGFDQARGDQVEIVNLRFADAPEVFETPEPNMFERLFGFTKDDMVRFAELGVFAGLTLLVLFLVVRPMIRQIIAPEKIQAIKNAILPGGGNAQLAGPNGALALPAPDGQDGGSLVQINNVNGGVNAMTLQRVGDVVKDNPQETVAVLRNWLHG